MNVVPESSPTAEVGSGEDRGAIEEEGSGYWLTGRCACRAVTFACVAPPRSIHYCHCTQCRRASGAAFAVLAWFASDAIRGNLLAAPSWRSSATASRGFCNECGSPLFLRYDEKEDIGIMLGAIDNPQHLIPDHHYGVESRLPWVDCGSDLPAQACKEST